MSYWPWWAGALALGSIAVGYARLSGRTLGVSGSLGRVARPGEELESERIERALTDDPEALQAALLAATEAEFGSGGAADAPPAPALEAPMPSPWIGHVAFLAMIAVGAFAASALRGQVSLHVSLGETYEHLVAGGWKMPIVLAAGGALVGSGTRMAGGCTSGHGLSGCGRLIPSSLASTAAFFGMGVVISMALAWAAR